MKRVLIPALMLGACVCGRAEASKWQKMNDCAAQAEKWEAKHHPTYAGISSTYLNRYSTQYDACYVRWTVVNNYNRSESIFMDDPFEDKPIATVYHLHLSEETDSGWIGDKSVTADKAQAFINDHMEN